MNTVSKRGRTTLTALALVLSAGAVISTCFIRKASAQVQQTSPSTNYTFGPLQVPVHLPGSSGGSTEALIALLLPAVQSQSPFELQFYNGDTDQLVRLSSAGNNPRIPYQYRVSIAPSQTGGRMNVMTITNLITGNHIMLNTGFQDVTVRLVPAVQNNASVAPLAASATISGFAGDGSVSYQYSSPVLLLPAV